MSLPPGATLGAYRITSIVGSGGMGEVYRAHDARLGRDVALKILPDTLAGNADHRARFEREARAVAAAPRVGPGTSGAAGRRARRP